jgi:transcription initiation factor TFIID TATA-box-binding protein
MEEIKIENVVANAVIAERFDLPWLESRLPRSEYKKKKFPGLIYRVERPKGAFLLFSTGKAVGTGFRSIDDVNAGVQQLLKDLDKLGIKIEKKPEFVVQNIVASADLHTEFVDLDTIAVNLGLENVEYEPEMFPGLVYRIAEPKTVLLIFGSGKVIITGCKNAEDCRKAMEILRRELQVIGVL